MPRHDPDLIAALAEGRLDPAQATALEREIASDPVASAALAEQRAALAAIASSEAPQLTMAERSRLRDTVAAAIGIEAFDPIAAQPQPRRVPWGSIGIAAAALAGLVAAVPVVGLLSTGGGDATASLELAAEAPTTALADAEQRSETVEEATGLPAAEDADDALTSADDGSDAGATFGSSTTLRATVPTSALAETVPAPTTVPPPAASTTSPTTPASTTTVTTIAPDGDELGRLETELQAIKSDAAGVAAMSERAVAATQCWVEDTGIRANPPPARYTFVYDNGELTVIVYYPKNAGVPGPFQVWGIPECDDVLVIP